jgi:spoIIIJ-associated protein
MDKEQIKIQTIKLLLEALLEKMTIKAEVEILDGGEYPQFGVRAQDAGILIGENGQRLSALNHLFRKMVDADFKKKEIEIVQFSLDINDYQTKKNEELKNLARMSAQRVRYFKKELEMEPMTAYERRVIHAALTEYPDIMTESVGETPNRRVVIKPLENK